MAPIPQTRNFFRVIANMGVPANEGLGGIVKRSHARVVTFKERGEANHPDTQNGEEGGQYYRFSFPGGKAESARRARSNGFLKATFAPRYPVAMKAAG
jgi:hypothetical protein